VAYLRSHSSCGRSSGDLRVTTDLSERLVRLPLWIGLEEHQDRVIDTVNECLTSRDRQIYDFKFRVQA
jgi:dTDP-4-amino-4,6-dideoxygalactose transaminase